MYAAENAAQDKASSAPSFSRTGRSSSARSSMTSSAEFRVARTQIQPLLNELDVSDQYEMPVHGEAQRSGRQRRLILDPAIALQRRSIQRSRSCAASM